jgi:hypothetical protein
MTNAMFPDKYDAVRQVIQSRLFTEWGTTTRVKYGNYPLDPAPEPSESWIALAIKFGDESPASMTFGTVVFRGLGLFQIDICVPDGEGTGNLNRLAKQLNDIFVNYETKSFQVTRNSYMEGLIEGNTWYKGILSFYFRWEYAASNNVI